MKTEQKLYAAVGAVVLLAGAFYMVSEDKDKDAQAHAVTAAGDLPNVTVTKEDADKVTKLVVKNKDKDEVTLEKKGDNWEVTKPLNAAADQNAIKQAIENMQKIKVKDFIADTPDVHKKYELNTDGGVHAVAYAGDKVVLDMFFGKRGSRGQMARQGGKGASAAVYTVDGYASFNWAKDIKGWRDKEMLKFEDGNAIAAEVDNKNGKFSFTKDGEDWKATFYKRNDKGKLGKGKDIAEFEPNKIKDLLRAYKNLKATDFAAKDADTGIADALNEGGVVRFQMKDEDAPSKIIKVGKSQEGSNRYASKEGDATVYVISSWSADWASAELSKFQKDKKEEGDDAGDKKDAKAGPSKDDIAAMIAKAQAGQAPKAPPKAPKTPAK